jgi:hypothetical protein
MCNPLFCQKKEFLSPSHSARGTACAEFKLRATLTVRLPTFANFKNMIFLHQTIQLYIAYKDPELSKSDKNILFC